jgi:hypothetical protein
VIGLVLITYFGDARRRAISHNFAGIVTFTSALLSIFLIDAGPVAGARLLGTTR